MVLRVLVIGLDGLVAEMMESAIDAEPSLTRFRLPPLKVGISGSVLLPDVIITAAGRFAPGHAQDRLQSEANVAVVVVDQAGGDATLYVPGQPPMTLADASPAQIAAQVGSIDRLRRSSRN